MNEKVCWLQSLAGGKKSGGHNASDWRKRRSLISTNGFWRHLDRSIWSKADENNRGKIKNKLHPEYGRKAAKNFAKNHPERVSERWAVWRYGDSRKISTLLNSKFEGSHLHHLGNGYAAFVPKELHNSVRHNLDTGKNMKEINSKVYEYLGILPVVG